MIKRKVKRMSKTLEQVEKEIDACGYATAIQEYSGVLTEINEILLNHFIVQREVKHLEEMSNYIRRLTWIMKPLPESEQDIKESDPDTPSKEIHPSISVHDTIQEIATDLRRCADPDTSSEDVHKALPSIIPRIEGLKEIDKIMADANVAKSLADITDLLQDWIAHGVVFTKVRTGELKFPFTIPTPMTFHRIGDTKIAGEWIATKKFCILTLNIYSHGNDDIEWEGFDRAHNLSLSSVLDADPESKFGSIFVGMTEDLLCLQCIPQELKDRHADIKANYAEARERVKKLLKWREHLQCAVQLEEKFKEAVK